jgi:hypothetical protein
MFCVIGSDAAAGFAASGADASSLAAADEVAGRCAASLSATPGDEDATVGAESSAPHALNAKVASAIKAALARRFSLCMIASGIVKAGAVSIPFKK